MLAKRVMLICMEAVVIVGVIGCGPPTIFSTDAAVYQNGKLYGVSSKDMEAVYSATLYAVDKLQLQVTEKAKDVFAAKVIAKSADGKIMVVTMKPTTDKKTQFEIGVGALGDEERARKVFDEIQIGLAMAKTK